MRRSSGTFSDPGVTFISPSSATAVPQSAPSRSNGALRRSHCAARRIDHARAPCAIRSARPGQRLARRHRAGRRPARSRHRASVGRARRHAGPRSLAPRRSAQRRHALGHRCRLLADDPRRGNYGRTYAQWTRQNHPGREGRYRVYLAHALQARTFPAGRYRVEVAVSDVCGNGSTASAWIEIDNGSLL